MKEAVAKIASLEVENFKRVRAVELVPSESGLTIIGGDNRQGKTSVLESIVATLGGKSFDPSSPIHDGADKAHTKVKLTNGITVEKSFTKRNSYLKVSAPGESKTGQELLNSFISEFALDIGTFIRARPKEQAKILLQSIGVDLSPFDLKEKELATQRELIGQRKRAAEGHEAEIIFDEEAGLTLKEPTDLMRELEAVVAHNGKIRQAAEELAQQEREVNRLLRQCETTAGEVERLTVALTNARARLANEQESLESAQNLLKRAQAAAAMGMPKDDSKIRERMAQVEAFNARVRQNLEKRKAAEKVAELTEAYQTVNKKIEDLRAERMALLERAGLPLPGLQVENEVLLYNGKAFDCMSGSEQMIVATAICRKIQPKMGFVLIDKMEQYDLKTLREFGQWAVSVDLQVIGTRVSKGQECSIIIEDGMAEGSTVTDEAVKEAQEAQTEKEPGNVGKRQFKF